MADTPSGDPADPRARSGLVADPATGPAAAISPAQGSRLGVGPYSSILPRPVTKHAAVMPRCCGRVQRGPTPTPPPPPNHNLPPKILPKPTPPPVPFTSLVSISVSVRVARLARRSGPRAPKRFRPAHRLRIRISPTAVYSLPAGWPRKKLVWLYFSHFFCKVSLSI